MLNALLATFHDVPALVYPGMQKQFEASVAQASVIHARIEASNDNVIMADDFWPAPDNWLAAYRPYIVKSGILLIPVKGVLLHGMGYAIGNWATGYVYLTKALERGLADPEVKGIAWIHDSPGGHVAGNFDLGDKIFAARDKKPMRAFASESSYSASYSLASAAGPITVSQTGGVGSIGVVTSHFDASKAMENDGYKVTFIHFGKHKVDGNSYEALPKDVKDRIQARIDELGEVFVSKVARNRGMDAQAVRDTEALTFTAKEATSNGLADAIGSLDDAIAVFAADLSLNDEDETMTEEEKKAAAMAVETAKTEALATGIAQGKTEGKVEGETAAKERISAIIDSDEGKKRPVAALAAALDTDMTVEQATKFLGKLAEEKPAAAAAVADPKTVKGKEGAAADFQTAMDKSEHPEAGAPGGKDEAQGSRADRAFALAGKPKKAA